MLRVSAIQRYGAAADWQSFPAMATFHAAHFAEFSASRRDLPDSCKAASSARMLARHRPSPTRGAGGPTLGERAAHDAIVIRVSRNFCQMISRLTPQKTSFLTGLG